MKRSIFAGSVVLTAVGLILQFTPLTRQKRKRLKIIGLSSWWRCVCAVRAWRSGHFHAIVVSAGPQPGAEEPRGCDGALS